MSEADRATLAGGRGEAAALAMRILCAMTQAQGARELIDVRQAHIDGCIYASPANLAFAERFAALGARVAIPTTMNAISAERGCGDGPAARLAEAYIEMGCRPSCTCAPYLLDSAPTFGERIGWAESNAVIFANSVLGARTPKHADFLDLCIALTGRAPLAGAYLDEGRRARRIIDVESPGGADDSFWPLLGYCVGVVSPDRIPLLCGLERAAPSRDDLKALCAAFGTTSAAPMLHIAGVTPECGWIDPNADGVTLTRADLAHGWASLNAGPCEIDLVAIGSPHASLEELCALAARLQGRRALVDMIVTTGADTLAVARREGVVDALQASGVRLHADICWCTISEPVFPPAARAIMTNSGKYAHYARGLSGRPARFGALADCVAAALTGRAREAPPIWLAAV